MSGRVPTAKLPTQEPEDERHENRGRTSRRDESDVTVTVPRGALGNLGPYLLVAVLGVAGGGGGTAAWFKGGGTHDDGKLDQVLAAQKDMAQSQKRIEERLTTLEAQGTSGQLRELEARVRKNEEQLAALRALQDHGK